MNRDAAITISAVAPLQDYVRRTSFRAALLALTVAGSFVSFRAAIAGQLRTEYLEPISKLTANEMTGTVLGAPFVGFGATLLITSSLLPLAGYRRCLLAASAFLSFGLLLMMLAGIPLAGEGGTYWLLLTAAVIQGIGWGLIEASVNPLTSSLYPEDRTHKLSVLHAWYPAGVVLGSLIGLAAGALVPWRVAALAPMVGALSIAALALRGDFPAVMSGAAQAVTIGQMFRAVVRRPSLLLWLAIMMLTATTEFAPGQWVDIALSQIVGMRGVLLLGYVSGLMFVMRHFAGPLVHRLSNIGLLTVSAVLSCLGLWALSYANSPLGALAATTLWGGGVCFLWPTMLATVADRHPDGGPLVFGLLAAAGAGCTYVTLPILGRIYDSAKIEAAGSGPFLEKASAAQLGHILRFAAEQSFQAVAIVPFVLIFVFGGLLAVQRFRRAQ